MKINIRTVCILFLAIGIFAASNAFAEDAISVLKVDTLIMEKGSDTYSLTVKAFVKNNGEPDDVTVNVVAIDVNGFELQNARLNGFLNQGQTKVLVAVVKIPKDIYQEIVRWEWKK